MIKEKICLKSFFETIKKSEENIRKDLDVIYNQIEFNRNNTRHNIENFNSLTKELNNISVLLDQVINNTFENDNSALDTVALIPYRGKPYVFKDGKRISTDKASSFTVNWATDSKTEVNIYNE